MASNSSQNNTIEQLKENWDMENSLSLGYKCN